MARYVVRPRGEVFDALRESPHLEGRTVYEHEPISTGLVNPDGYPIYRTPEPIGLVLLKEKD
jgi:hypothetical protein